MNPRISKPVLEKRTREAKAFADVALLQAQGLPLIRKQAKTFGVHSRQWQMEVRLIDAPEMTKLNSKWRKKAYATDVLSFNSPELFRRQGILGEIIICWPTLKEQAKKEGHTVRQELEVLIVHGTLHLLGVDHERSPKELKLQAKLEQILLKAMGSSAQSGLIDRVNHGAMPRLKAV